MSAIDEFLSKLSKVKGRNGHWTACCPAHGDKTPSLAIREDDGKIILHCFGGCDARAVIEAVGMAMTDLFPPTDRGMQPQKRVKFLASDLLQIIGFESSIVSIAARDMAKGRKIPATDLARLQVACNRIASAVEAAS